MKPYLTKRINLEVLKKSSMQTKQQQKYLPSYIFALEKYWFIWLPALLLAYFLFICLLISKCLVSSPVVCPNHYETLPNPNGSK